MDMGTRMDRWIGVQGWTGGEEYKDGQVDRSTRMDRWIGVQGWIDG